MTIPNRREVQLANAVGYATEPDELLAAYRSELLKPFEEMLDDFEQLKDERVAKRLREIISTAKGVP